MKILRADHMGMCFGVRDAIALATRTAATRPLTILGELVHNERVVADLAARGARTDRRLEDIEGGTVMITAHGTSQKTLQQAQSRGLSVLEATCPLVHHAHRCLKELVDRGFHPVVIGKRDHVEVRGMTDDLAEFDVILSEDDILALKPRPRFGVVAQTTQPIDKVNHLAGFLRRRFPGSEVVYRDTVCQPTKQRQSAAVELAKRCDVVVVIGGERSNNTRELVETCRARCPQVHHVQGEEDLQTAWFVHAVTVGVTAGTSTPDAVIAAVERRLHELAEVLRGCPDADRHSHHSHEHVFSSPLA